MKKSIEKDIILLADILEDLTRGIDIMSEADMIDLAARLKPVAKHCETIDTFVKNVVKDKLRHKEGERLGGMFKAVLKLITVNRFKQKLFAEAHPRLTNEFTKEDTDERVIFELREVSLKEYRC